MKLGADFPEPMYHGGPKASATHTLESPPPHRHSRSTSCLSSTASHQKQVTSGVVDQNSGGNLIYLSPGLRLSYDKWSS